MQIAMLTLTSSNDQSFVGPAGDNLALSTFVKDNRSCQSEITPRTKSSLQVPSSQKGSAAPE
jgi:hypothetical protein